MASSESTNLFDVAGSGFSFLSDMQASQAAADAANANADIAEFQAGLTREQTTENVRRQSIIARKQIGSERANYGASGVQLSGSALDVLQESAANAEMDKLWIQYAGDMKAKGLEMTAEADRQAAAAAEKSGQMAMFGDVVKTGVAIALL